MSLSQKIEKQIKTLYMETVKDLAEMNEIEIKDVIRAVGTLKNLASNISLAIELSDYGRRVWLDDLGCLKMDVVKNSIVEDFKEYDPISLRDANLELYYEMMANR